MFKKTTSYSIIICSLAMLLIQAPTSQADNNPLELDCSETYLYYNTAPNSVELPNLDVPEITRDCLAADHQRFPGAYIPARLLDANNPTPVTLTDAGQPATQPWGHHVHRFINESPQEINKNGAGFDIFKFAILSKFEIKLQPDFMANTDLNKVRCPNLPNDNNCQGIGLIELNDGTKYPFINTFDKQNGIITWEFPGDKVFNGDYAFVRNWKLPKNGQWVNPDADDWDSTKNGTNGNLFWEPYLVNGNSPYLYETILGIPRATFDSSLDSSRQLERSFNVLSKAPSDIGPEWSLSNDETKAWSATATSRVLIKDWTATIPTRSTNASLVNQYDGSDGTARDGRISFDELPWTQRAAQAGYEATGNNYYWFPIGTTTTVWESPIQEGPVCENLNIRGSAKQNSQLGGDGVSTVQDHPVVIDSALPTAYTLGIGNIAFSDDKFPEGAKILWQADNPDGRFYKWVGGQNARYVELTMRNAGGNAYTIQDVTAAFSSNPITALDITTPIFYSGTGKVTANLQKGAGAIEITDECRDEVTIVPIENACESFELVVTRDVQVKKDFSKPETTLANEIKIKTLTFEPQNIIPGAIMIDWESTDPEGEFWITNDAGTGLRLNGTRRTQTPLIANLDNTKHLYYIGTGTVNSRLAGISFEEANVNVCKDQLSFGNQCEALAVDHQDPIYNQTVSTFNSSAYSDLSNATPFESQIHYWTDPGYGIFYTLSPEDLPVNPADMVTEIPAEPANGGDLFGVIGGGVLGGDFEMDPVLSVGDLGFSVSNSTIWRNNNLDSLYYDMVEQKLYQSIDIPFQIPEPNPIETQFNPAELQQNTNFSPVTEINTPTSVETGTFQNSQNYQNFQNYGNTARDFGGTSVFGVNNSDIQLHLTDNSASNLTITAKEYNKVYSADQFGTMNLLADRLGPNFAAFANLGESITVDANQKVYFYALQPGENKVHVQALAAEEGQCARDFDIEELPQIKTCEAIEFSATDVSGKQPFQCLNGGTYRLTTTFYEDAAKQTLLDRNTTRVRWTSTDLNGKFFEIGAQGIPVQHPRQYDGKTSVFYSGAGQVTAKIIELDGLPYDDAANGNKCRAQINQCPEGNRCASLNILSNPVGPLLVGQNASFSLTGLDTNGNALPAATPVIWNNTTGTLTFGNQVRQSGPLPPLSLVYNQVPVAFTNSQAEGFVEVSIPQNDPLYSAACADQIDIVSPLICRELIPTINKINLGNVLEPKNGIEPNNIYNISSNTNYSDAQHVGTIDYTIDPNYGTFVVIQPDALRRAIFQLFLETNTPLTKATIETNLAANTRFSELPAQQNNATVYLITYSDAPGNNPAALTIRATGRTEAACNKIFGIVKAAEPCTSVVVSLLNPPFDPEEDNVIYVREGDFGGFTGKFKFTATHSDGTVADEENSMKFYKAGDELNGANPKEFLIAEARAGVVFSGGETGDTIAITAIGDLNGNGVCNAVLGSAADCESLSIIKPAGTWTSDDFTDGNDQKFTIEVETNPAGLANNLEFKWTVDSDEADTEWDKELTDNSMANPLVNTLRDINVDEDTSVTIEAVGFRATCSATKVLKNNEEQPPEIEKLVYDKKNDEWEKTINIGGKNESGNGWLSANYQYVKYAAIFDPGSSKSVDIQEKNFENGAIKSATTGEGTFDYEGMAIIADTSGNDDGYFLYQSESFVHNEGQNTELPTGKKYKEYKYYDEDSEDFFTDEDTGFDCENDNRDNKLCIEDIENVSDNFSNGEKISFKNITDDIEKIYIIYKTENNTVITDDYCIEMIERFNACGEEFKNKIWFEADFENGETNETGEDNAKAIVICPFILTREGGDVFFHDAITTGIDVSACYDVETCEGPCIRPPKETTGRLDETGQPIDAPIQEVLSAPTHDICKLSNTGDNNSPAYENVFKNFSSSVCEMESEVAEIWKEKYINEAIQANIEKIARFGATQGDVAISSMQDVEREFATTAKSGVFVIEGNLTIGGNGDFSIGASGALPAAQTYIVKGGTLTINSDIKYNDQNVDVSSPKNIPSAAFIVIDGNIIINDNVEQIDGVLMAVDTEGDVDGEINPTSATNYDHPLVINGSLIGDINNLFTSRRAIGDPLKDQGSITIKYDERILLNTPPGLNELIDVNQLKVAN